MSEDLSINDTVMPKCYVPVLWIFDYKIEDLEKPLLEFLEKYCPTAFGKIIYDDKKPNYGRLIKSRSNSNKIFSRVEQHDMAVSHYINCSVQDLNIFLCSVTPSDTSSLLFFRQINVHDGTLLAAGIHHQFSDGHGFFTLIDRFSKWVRYKDDSKIKPFIHDRSLLKPAADIHYEHIEYSIISPVCSLAEMPVIDVLIRKYNKQELFDKLKIISKNVSFNDVLVAWLTQTISQISQISLDETIKVNFACNGRTALGLSSDYFGNCVFGICLQFKMIDLINKSVNELAEQINIEKKSRMTKDYMTSALAWITRASAPVYPGTNVLSGKDIIFSNWSRFPMYQIDFGHGSPRRVRVATSRSRAIIILPTPTNDVELYIGLKKEHADELLKKLE